MSQIPSLRAEIEELNDVDAFIMETFKHCDNMKTDILEYSSDVKRELTNFKNQLKNLSEIQLDIAGLATAITRLDSYDSEDIGTDPVEISNTFDRIYRSAKEDQYIHDDVEKLLTSVDFYITGQEEDMDVEDSELLVTTTISSYKDPLTKTLIKDPVKSITCKHVYDRSTIFRYIERSSRCPYSGCSTVLTRDDIVDDLETKRKLMNMK